MAHADEGKPWGVVDPNTEHQVWTSWAFRVYVHGTGWQRPEWETVKREFTRFFAKASVGHCAELSVAELRVSGDLTRPVYHLDWRVEDNRALDLDYRERIRQHVERFAEGGFGTGQVSVTCDVRLLAGDAENGKPRAQLIVMPSVIDTNTIWGERDGDRV